MTSTQIARGLGLFSLGLGAAEMLAPRWLGRQIGVGDHRKVLRAFGAREIVTGLGVLSPRFMVPGLWARVAGDALDLAMLGVGATRSRSRARVAAAIGMVAGVALMDFVVARRLQGRH